MSELSNPKVHNVRFFKPKPNAVYCLALQEQQNKLAVSRSNASIEIWNLTHIPYIEKTIASSTNNFSVEGLAWCNSRLFSVGLHGFLIEYDLYKLDVKSRSAVTGEASFCLDINKKKSHIAIGTEQGFLNIFAINEDEVLFEKFLDKQEGRILCLKFDYSGEFIVSGGLDAIRIWSVKTNQALHKLITGRSEKHKPTIVWCLAITSDFTILSGDSRGILSVWDGKVGAQVESYQSHRADILSLCLSEDENSLFCAGVDPDIVNYVRVKFKDNDQKWVRSIQRKIHDHDVRALVVSGPKLYSSGVDGYLSCSSFPPKVVTKFPPILQNPVVTLCSKARYIMLRHPTCVEIWSLGEIGAGSEVNAKFYVVEKEPKKLVVLQKIVQLDDGTEGNEGIACAAISDDGAFVLYSTRLGTRLLKLCIEGSSARVRPIAMLDEMGETPCLGAVFATNSSVIVAPNTGGLQVIAFDNDIPRVRQRISTKLEIKDTITLLSVSKSAQFLAAADPKGNIAVWTLTNNEYRSHCKLPRYEMCPTAIAFHPRVSNVVVAYSNGAITEFDLDKKESTKFSRALSENPPKQLRSGSSVFRNITFDPRTSHVIIAHDDDSVVVINKEEKDSVYSKSKKKSKVEGRTTNAGQFKMRSIKKYKHLVHFGWLSDDEMVAVEVNPLNLLDQLPPCFNQNAFGKK